VTEVDYLLLICDVIGKTKQVKLNTLCKFELVKVSIAIQLVTLLAWFSSMCCAGEKLKQCPDLFAVNYVIMLKYRKYPIDDQVFIDTEVCVAFCTVR